MRIIKSFFLFLIAFSLYACIQIDDVTKKDLSTSILIDVRSKQEFDSGHLDKAIHIEYSKIKQEIGKFVNDKKSKILLYCEVGGRAGIAKKTLVDMGYTNVINAGGYDDLRKL